MKKTLIVVHQNYVEDVIKKLHETGLMQIIDVSKEEKNAEFLENNETSVAPSEAAICANYELRLSRIIDILNKIKPKKTGIKAFLNPEPVEVKTVDEDRTLEEIFSNVEGVLAEIEKQILENDKKILEFNEEVEKIKNDITQLNFLKDFELDLSDLGESEYLFVKAGVTKDIGKIENAVKSLSLIHI